ncbi:MAG: hypothetical protein S4CHLAM7_02560 [Chlamydiae bacterium]|nr:hypothetical protein [Chlamydiota bacterium]
MQWLPVWAAAMASAFVVITLRQFLVGKIIDIFVSLILFALLFITNTYYVSEMATGILLVIGSGYAFIRQCFGIYAYKLRHSQRIYSEEKKPPQETPPIRPDDDDLED